VFWRDLARRDFIEERRIREISLPVEQRDPHGPPRRISPWPIPRQQPRQPQPRESASGDDDLSC